MDEGLDARCVTGGILWLRELIEEHPSAFAYDFRHRFNTSVFDVGGSMRWDEAYLLTAQLLKDTDSAVFAACNEWKFPVKREWLVMADLFDLTLRVNAGKRRPKPYPRPFTPGAKRVGKTKRNFGEIRTILDRMNPKD